MTRSRTRNLRRRLYQVLEQGPVGDAVGTWVDRALVTLIVINLVAVALESMPQYATRYATAFAWIEYVSLAVLRLSMRCVCGSRSSTAHTAIYRTCARASNTRSAPLASSI